MATKLFVTFPVKDLAVAKRFFRTPGFDFDERFANEGTAAVIINADATVLLLVEPYFTTFTTKRIADTTSSTEATFALDADSRARVDELAERAAAAGGDAAGRPRNLGFLYSRSVTDPDGQLWAVFHSDMSGAAPAGMTRRS